ncbi:hypothetical protein ABW20_dc0102134 [Dactylellina cionopaga]|nr:hypothetical protein ABW20_dc0102134 [Dactylellina cionopaga]
MTALRIRENQRRSRAKRKEYLNSLEQRLAEYSTKGVQATIEMQIAARAVALENQRLRNLLTTVGVSNEEVNTYLQSFKSFDKFQDKRPEQFLSHQHSADFGVETVHSEKLAPAADASAELGPKDNTNRRSLSLEVLPTMYIKSRLCSTSSDGASDLETPCEAAANIILRMRGQGDESDVYSRFGCENGFPQGCSVKNTVLFQIMDEV